MKQLNFLFLLLVFVACSKQDVPEVPYKRKGTFPTTFTTKLKKSVEITSSAVKSAGVTYLEGHLPLMLTYTSSATVAFVYIERVTRGIAPTGKYNPISFTVDQAMIDALIKALSYTDSNPALEEVKKQKGKTQSSPPFEYLEVKDNKYKTAGYDMAFTIKDDKAKITTKYYYSLDGKKVRLEASINISSLVKFTLTYDADKDLTKYASSYSVGGKVFEMAMVLQDGRFIKGSTSDTVGLSVFFKQAGVLKQSAYCFAKDDTGFFAMTADGTNYEYELFSGTTKEIIYSELYSGADIDASQKPVYDRIKSKVKVYLADPTSELTKPIATGAL